MCTDLVWRRGWPFLYAVAIHNEWQWHTANTMHIQMDHKATVSSIHVGTSYGHCLDSIVIQGYSWPSMQVDLVFRDSE